MEFYPNTPFDENAGQHLMWDAIKDAFRRDAGVAFYRYSVKAKHNGVHYEPDTLVVLRERGVVVLECKGIRLEQLTEVQGQAWYLRDSYSDQINPIAQVQKQMYAVKDRVLKVPSLRSPVRFHAWVVLPFITRAAWIGAGLPEQSMVLFQEDLKLDALRDAFSAMTAHHPQPELSNTQWDELCGVFGAKIISVRQVSVPINAPADHPQRVIRDAYQSISQLDATQLTAALITPPGPQRLRGVAGSGKTVILARRIALLHARHPDWQLAFVFYTKALYDQVRDRILHEYQAITDISDEPDWDRLRIWHAWGGKLRQGFYRHLCQTTKQIVKRFDPEGPDFTEICDRLETDLKTRGIPVPELFDAIFIDEGQDLPHSFYRLALATLRDPKRLTWAFDEAQSVNNLSAPEPAIVFGRDSSNKPNVDLKGRYEGGAYKSMTMRHSYRTPNSVLMAAHAVNMGLFREGGAVQGMTNAKEWRAIGYEILKGEFRREGETIRVHRPQPSGTPLSHERNAHPFDIDSALCERALTVSPPIDVHAFTDPMRERDFIVASVKLDLERGFQPEDLLVVVLDSKFGFTDYLRTLQQAFTTAGIAAHVVGDDWWIKGSVPLTHVYRAKGNEAARVYACRFEFAHQALSDETEVQARNRALVAMTRARFWLTVSSGGPAPVLEEIVLAGAQYPHLEFQSFTQHTLHRVLEIADDEPDEQLPLGL